MNHGVDPALLPYSKRPSLHLCVRQGLYPDGDGVIYAAQLFDEDGEIVISLTPPDVSAPGEFLSGGATLRVGEDVFPIRGYWPYTGNICWDSARLGPATAQRLVAKLLREGWHVEEVAIGEGT